MKVKLFFLLAAIGMPLVGYTQTQPFLFNKGNMVVKGTADPLVDSNVVLYIKGDFISGTTTQTTAPSITLDNSRTVLTGNFYHNAAQSVANASVFSLTDNPSALVFAGTTQQQILTNGTVFSEIPDKRTSYIKFPTLVVNNPTSVIISPELGADVKSLQLSKGTFIIDSERITSDNLAKYGKVNASTSTSTNPDERTSIANLLVGQVTYNAASTLADRGAVQVNLALDPANSYTYTNGRYGSLVGMGSPFQKMYSDYFTWNYLLAPSQESLLGPGKRPIIDTEYALVPGKGYLVGNGLLGTDYADYEKTDYVMQPDGQKGDPMGEARFNNRFQDGYIFNRAYFADFGGADSNNRFGSYSSTNAAYTDEKLNVGDVVVTLSKGYNYLANPYTAPLDISDLLNNATTATDWGNVTINNNGSGDLYNAVWLVNGTSKGSALYNMLQNPNQDVKLPINRIQVNVTTLVATNGAGSTYLDDNLDGSVNPVGGTLIPPLQMFIVYSYKDNLSLTIPASKRKMGRNQFIRSAETISRDNFVFEVYDQTTQTTDRASIVLRQKSEIISNPNYSNLVKLNAAVKSDDTKATSVEDAALQQGISSQLYSRGANNEKLLINYVPYTKNVDSKVAVPLGLIPSALDQNIVLRGLTLGTLTEFDNIILEDKLLGKQTVMTPETEYATTIKSTDPEDRFILYFTKGVDGIEDEIDNNSSASIYSHYSNGTLTVGGFSEKDFGSTLSVFDIQGRFITQTKVNDFTVTITDRFAPGAFVVKVTGNNSYVAKFLVR